MSTNPPATPQDPVTPEQTFENSTPPAEQPKKPSVLGKIIVWAIIIGLVMIVSGVFKKYIGKPEGPRKILVMPGGQWSEPVLVKENTVISIDQVTGRFVQYLDNDEQPIGSPVYLPPGKDFSWPHYVSKMSFQANDEPYYVTVK